MAYLALNERSLRREQLCELLWEIPDDPRGSLRWSLSKIRKLVDEPGASRVIADRNSVSFDADGVDIDVKTLCSIAGSNIETLSTEGLQLATDLYRGDFLEGLDLADFHDFYTWCIGERERAARCQASLLKELLARLKAEPEQALDYANQLVTLTPFDQSARATLIALLLRLDRQPEAEQQYRLGRQKLEESGDQDWRALYRIDVESWRSLATRTPACWVAPCVARALRKPLLWRDRMTVQSGPQGRINCWWGAKANWKLSPPRSRLCKPPNRPT